MTSGSAIHRPRHVFCIDGSQTFRRLLRVVFELRGFVASVEGFSPDLFDQIRLNQPDVLVVDLAFGETDGGHLLSWLASGDTAHTPVIVTSTDRRLLELARIEHASAESSRAFLRKPFEMFLLIETAIKFVDAERGSVIHGILPTPVH
jgi:CheY-like chemotaxis protein